MRYLITAIVVATLLGCQSPSEVRTNTQTRGQPAEYRAGFQDGCNSGYSAAGNIYYKTTKDVRRFTTDELYRMGWQDGFADCKGSYEAWSL